MSDLFVPHLISSTRSAYFDSGATTSTSGGPTVASSTGTSLLVTMDAAKAEIAKAKAQHAKNQQQRSKAPEDTTVRAKPAREEAAAPAASAPVADSPAPVAAAPAAAPTVVKSRGAPIVADAIEFVLPTKSAPAEPQLT